MQYSVLSTLVAIFVSVKAAKPRSINLALETVFEFEKGSDIDFINNVQTVLNKVKDILQQTEQDGLTRRSRRYKFTDFLEDIIFNLNSLNDKDLKQVVRVIDSEIRMIGERQIAAEKNLRRLLSSKLNQVNIKSPRKIRNTLNKLLEDLQNGKKDKNNHFLVFLNSLYKKESEEKLLKFIKELKIFRETPYRKSIDLQRSIRKAIQLLIFDHLSNLSENTKRKVQSRIKDFLLDDYYNATDSRVHKPQRHVERKIALQGSNSEVCNEEFTKEVSTSPFEDHEVILIETTRVLNQITKTKNANLRKEKKKLTYVTLYPESLEIEKDKSKTHFRTAAIKPRVRKIMKSTKKKTKTLQDVITLTSIGHSAQINVNFVSNGSYNDISDTDKQTTHRKVRILRRKTKNSKLSKVKHRTHLKMKKKDTTSNISSEYFGNLYKTKSYIKDNKSKLKELGRKSVTGKIQNITIEPDIFVDNRFSKKVKTIEFTPVTNEPLLKEGYRRAKKLNNILGDDKLTTKGFSFINKVTAYITRNDISYPESLTKKAPTKISSTGVISETDNKIDSDESTLKKYTDQSHSSSQLHNISTNSTTSAKKTTIMKQVETETSNRLDPDLLDIKNSKNNSNSMDLITTPIDETKTTDQMESVSSFDINNFLKNSEINAIENADKRQEIERKLKEDMDNLFSLTSANATTEAFTDMFEALEDTFNLSPLH